MQVAKWGNSLAIRLPAAVVEVLGLKEGDEIEIHVVDGKQFGVAERYGLSTYDAMIAASALHAGCDTFSRRTCNTA
jgi:antitoxin component of MazEF toxin-antitoxin module